MRSDLKVLFLGNHTVGVTVMKAISEEADLIGVVAHPEDPEDGTIYESVFNHAQKLKVRSIRAVGTSEELAYFANLLSPDLILICDYKYLIPSRIFKTAKYGAINLHPSLLPKYRGRAPINWAILKGETTLGLTAHWVDEGMDSGEILIQETYELQQNEDISNALEKLYPLYKSITQQLLERVKSKKLRGKPQKEENATYYPRRQPKDGLINWTSKAKDIWNLVRAVAPPYPGAFTETDYGRLFIHKISGLREFSEGEKPMPGSIIKGSFKDKEMIIACSDQAIKVSDFRIHQSENI